MKYSNFIILITALIFTVNLRITAQCRDKGQKMITEVFADTEYIHDGHLNVSKLEEGDKADIVKSFFSGQPYCLAVKNDEGLQNVDFELLDMDRKVIFSSKKENNKTFYFKLKTTQKLIIAISVPEPQNADEPKSGCVAILIGLKY